jgi:hypothetical protein
MNTKPTTSPLTERAIPIRPILAHPIRPHLTTPLSDFAPHPAISTQSRHVGDVPALAPRLRDADLARRTPHFLVRVARGQEARLPHALPARGRARQHVAFRYAGLVARAGAFAAAGYRGRGVGPVVEGSGGGDCERCVVDGGAFGADAAARWEGWWWRR